MGNNINKQTNSSQSSNKNTTNNNTINDTTNNINNNTNTSQNNTSINNCASSNSRIITNDPNENLNHIIQTGIETAQNIQLNLSQNRVTYIKPLSTSNINVTETTTAPSEAAAPSTTNVPPTANPCENIFQNISQTSALLQNINNIREQLARLNIDPSQRIYYENCVVPLLTTLYELTASSATLATSVNFLATSPVVHPKTSQLRDTTHLIYHINEKCEDVYKVLKKRIDIMLDMC